MSAWSLDANNNALTRNGKTTFLLVDTLWAAFARVSDAEWLAYLRLRRRQGFNAVAISLLPIPHDRSIGGHSFDPFPAGSSTEWDVSRLDRDYFTRARRMVDVAIGEGVTPVLALLWCTFVPGTWASKIDDRHVMSTAQRERYLDVAISELGGAGPIFVVSGDADFGSTEATSAYSAALHQVREQAPHCLSTMHSTPDAALPSTIADDPALDFYTYQSGHDTEWESRAVGLARAYTESHTPRPVINLEPCYEGAAISGSHRRLRHAAQSVRAASWSSVLAGAGAGLGYGAHGVWSWHRQGDRFSNPTFSGNPPPAIEALHLRGARDVGLLREIIERHELFNLKPAQELLTGDSEAQVAQDATGKAIVAWMPAAFDVFLEGDFRNARVECWDLEHGRLDRVVVDSTSDQARFHRPDFNSDAVLVITG